MDAVAAAARLARVDAGAVSTLVTRLHVMTEQLRAAADSLASTASLGSLRGWAGGGHDTFLRAIAAARARLLRQGDALEVVASALSSLNLALQAVQDEARAADRLLIVAGPTDPRPAIASELAGAVAAFHDADLRAAYLLGEALLLDLTQPSSWPVRLSALAETQEFAREVSVVAPVPASAPGVAMWWAGLTPAARASVASRWAGWPGSIDGIPAPVRDAVNRSRLASAVQEAEQVYGRSRLHDSYAHQAARTRLIRLKALAAALAPPGTQLLLFDASGDGEAVVATGNVETSRSVAVVIPGMTSDLGDAPALIRETRRLAAAAGPGTAAVMWLGYDAPDVHQALSDASAKSGAASLQRFVEGLRSTAALAQHVTVAGHSYGSLVAGLAAKHGLGADDLVLLASPGVEAAHASELHLPAGHVWAASVPTDPIRLVFWPSRLGWLAGLELPAVFGPDPASTAFGARLFPAGGALGHSGYFDAGTQSLASLGRIVSGRPVG
ncbi:MAG TPA: alpha/beta hydrolase [Frankiaceae bacterium]|nr:alpha/beta hydrolase [Frankiaceae bacterium]